MSPISEEIVTRVDRAFKNILRKERRALASAKLEMESYVNALQSPQSGAQEAAGGLRGNDEAAEG